MEIFCITGAGGFIGKRLTEELSLRPGISVRAFSGNLLNAEELDEFLRGGTALVHLAYMAGDHAVNLAAAEKLAQACVRAGVRRFVHCSTAVVAGRVGTKVINEATKCNPISNYEKTKLKIEAILAEKLNGVELVILRPTAVFGPEGKNLLNIAEHLLRGNERLNYFRSCLYGNRRMNLVPLENVVSAIIYFASGPRKYERETFIISEDDDPENHYRAIEGVLRKEFGRGGYRLPAPVFPPVVLKLLLWLAGKSNIDPDSIYDNRKLRAAGCPKKVSLRDGLKEFAAWFRQRGTE